MKKSMVHIFLVALIYLLTIVSAISSDIVTATDSIGNSYNGNGAVSPGQSITIKCPHIGSVKWYKQAFVNGSANDQLSSRQNIQLDGSELTISDVKFADTGVYYCEQKLKALPFFLYVFNITTTANGIVPTRKVENDVNGITFNQSKISEKESVNVSCFCESGAGSPTMSIDWKGGLYENLSNQYNINTTLTQTGVNSTLILKKSVNNRALYGAYTCSCSTSSGNKLESKVFMEVLPIFEEQESSKRATEGDDIVLSCNVWAFPAVINYTIHWRFQNSAVLRDGIVTTMNASHPGMSQLLIAKVTSSDRGIYTCHATNAFGSNSFTTMLRVKGRYAALWPLIGIVLQLIVLVAIIIIYEWKKSHKSSEDSAKTTFDTRTEPDATVTDKITDRDSVRQRLVNA